MGLSTKQVSSDGRGWNQGLLQASNNLELPNNSMKKQSPSQQEEEEEGDQQLKCPRCESTNTKFCYYNNYNKSQPRHFCKACKRHWTKGGTLRNVPIGGGRKNKRKASNTTTKTASKTSSSTSKGARNTNMIIINGQQPNLNMASITSEVAGNENKGFNESKDGVFVGPQDLQYPYSSLGNFESLSSSISSTITSLQSPSTQLYSSLEETIMNNNMSMASWSVGVGPTLNNHNWGWDDFDKFDCDDVDLITIPWDDPEINP